MLTIHSLDINHISPNRNHIQIDNSITSQIKIFMRKKDLVHFF